MGRPAKTIVISGYYGFRNSGDEAVLQSILLALQEESRKQEITIEPVVLSVDPEWTTRMYGVKAVHRMKAGPLLAAIRQCDGLISGGGSLLQDATGKMSIPYYVGVIKIAQWFRKPTFVYSQGIGPVNSTAFYPLIRSAFKHSAYVSVRDQESADLLKSMHLGQTRIEVVPDPVMGLPLKASIRQQTASNQEGRKPILGVSVRYWNEDRSELAGLAAALDRIVADRDVDIRFLPFHLPSDEEASQEVVSRMGEAARALSTIVRDVTHPQDMLGEVSACDAIIGMRLHSLIYAASQQVPMIGISYDPKIDQFLHRLNMRSAATTARFDSTAVAAETLRQLDERRHWQLEKGDAIERLKAEANKPAQQVVSFLRQKG
ncbi:polysaccharide pyruvyl transferase CsaB [Paenibacillus sp. MBLB4367]|uniref:polysaccharide pyruvyl transferase CsaB n=1 Tax=Paenibacillus sp. MBLB4367 TaxID=3384767 RepID=UPI0039081569